MEETLTITLRKPVKLGEVEFKELRLREPTGAEWMQFDKLDGVEADLKAIAIVSGVPEPAVNMIGTRDIIRASRFLAGFLSIDPQIGASA